MTAGDGITESSFLIIVGLPAFDTLELWLLWQSFLSSPANFLFSNYTCLTSPFFRDGIPACVLASFLAQATDSVN